LTLPELVREPIIDLIPECDTPADVDDVLQELCEESFTEQLAGWYTDSETSPEDRSFDVFCQWFETTSIIRCWLISVMNPLVAESD